MSWERARDGFDEIFTREGTPRPHYAGVVSVLESLNDRELARRRGPRLQLDGLGTVGSRPGAL